MNLDLQKFKEDSARQKQANKTFYEKLRREKPKLLDNHFHSAHDEVFEQTDCLTCANCCKTTSPLFTQHDIDRLAKALKMRPSQFFGIYLKVDEDGDYVLKSSPCPFLGAGNYCSVYTDRPAACREYPHTNRKRMVQILDITFRNTLVCPAVLTITEKLKKIL